tara:strand:- start:125 stop:418 length:294 start_codon:yes stop_codon:yes gene_type:complete
MKDPKPKSKYGMPFYTMQDWIDNEDWKKETQEKLLNRLASFCIDLRKTTSYKHFARNTMLNSPKHSDQTQVHVNDTAKLMQKILEHMGAKKYRMSMR